jgi:hypothetical protein
MSHFEVHIFEEPEGYRVVIPGIGHFDARSMFEARRIVREYLRLRVEWAFPDRPPLADDGAEVVLRYSIALKEVRPGVHV